MHQKYLKQHGIGPACRQSGIRKAGLVYSKSGPSWGDTFKIGRVFKEELSKKEEIGYEQQ